MKQNLTASQKEIDLFHKMISKKVCKARIKSKLSQLEVSTLMGFESATFYGNAENNRSNKHFNIEHLFLLSRIYKISIKELLDDTL